MKIFFGGKIKRKKGPTPKIAMKKKLPNFFFHCGNCVFEMGNKIDRDIKI